MGNLKPMLAKEVTAAVWHGIFWWINLNFFQQLPKEMLLFPGARWRKRAWLGFIFMTSHFFAGKHSAQITTPTLCKRKRTHKHRSASENASMSAMGKLHDKTYQSSLKQHLQPWRTARFYNANWYTIDWVSSYLICLFGFFPGVLSLRASIIIFLNRRVAQRNIAMTYKRERSISFSQ